MVKSPRLDWVLVSWTKYLRTISLVLCLSTVPFSQLPPLQALVHGTHKVLVVPIEFKEVCPDPNPGFSPACQPPAVFVKPPRHKADDWKEILSKGVNGYYQRATYSETTFDFHMLKKPWIKWVSTGFFGVKLPWPDFWELFFGNGWWPAPWSFQKYCGEWVDGPVWKYCKGPPPDYPDPPKNLADTALKIADGELGFDGRKQYERVAVFLNVHARAGQASYGIVWFQESGVDGEAISVLAHELGHAPVGLPDLYDSPGMGDWDIMAWDPPLNHFSAWTKRHRKWMLDDSAVTVFPPGKTVEMTKVHLGPLANPPTADNPKRVIRLPFKSYNLDPFLGYHVECRLKTINGDEKLPGEGAFVYSVDEKPPKGKAIANAIKLLKPGEEWSDPKSDIVIRHVFASADGCDVVVQRETYYVADLGAKKLWFDSKKNDWKTYPPDQLDRANLLVPKGRGDPFWSGQENRIHFSIANLGDAPSGKFRVRVYVMQPITMEVPADCKSPMSGKYSLIDERVYESLEPGKELVSYSLWSPKSDDPARISVVIEKVENELSTSNNVSEMIVESSAPGKPKDFKFNISNSCPSPTRHMVETRSPCPHPDLSDCWMPRAMPDSFILEPRETKTIAVQVTPPKTARAGDAAEISIVLLQDDGRHHHPTPVDEMSFLMRVAEPATITCNAPERPTTVGSAVIISGSISPAHAGSPVALEYRSPSGRTMFRVVTTDVGGGYRDNVVHDEAGGWSVQVHWQGDVDHWPAMASCIFSLAPATPAPTPPPRASFILAVSPSSGAIQAGSYALAAVAVISVGGYDRAVTLSYAAPPGFSVGFAPASGTPSFRSFMRVVVAQGVSEGSYGVVVVGTGVDGLSYSIVFTAIVTRPTPPPPPPRPAFDFSISASPTSQTVPPGQSASFRIAVTLVGGSTQPVGLSVEGLPFGASASFSPTAGNPNFASALTITTSPRTPLGTYTLTILGTGGGITRSATVTLTVVAAVR